MSITKGNGLTAGNSQPVKTHSTKLHFTSTEAQIQRLLKCLAMRPHHTHELRKLGISHPAGRIRDLRKRGYEITVGRVVSIDSDGFAHPGVALYELVSVPETNVRTTHSITAPAAVSIGGQYD